MSPTHAENIAADLTVSQAARLARVSADTIRRYSDDGTLPCYRTPKQHRRFHAEDVLRVFSRTIVPPALAGDAA